MFLHVEYDEAGNEIARIDAKGNRTEFEYDAYRRLIQTVYPDGSAEQKHYDTEGNLLAVTDRLGRITQYHYDPLNRQTRVIYPDGTFTQTEYDGAGRVIAEIDARGNRTEHEYDRAGRRTVSRNAALNETAFEYDKDGNLIKQTDAKGHTVSYEYDVLDRKIKTTFHDGSAMRDQYDALGRVIAKIDQSGIQTQFEYDSVGRLTAVIDALGQRTRYAYDEVGNKLSQTDANLHTTHWSYDALGQVQSRTLPEGQVESFTYDANGNQETHTDFNGHLTAYDYDVNNRLITVTYHDGSGESYTYDVNGNRETASDARGSTRYTYDDRDRLKTETQPDGTVLSYDYDAAGNRTLLQTQIPNAQSGVTDITTTRYSYDNLNRLYTVTDHHNQVTTYGYDAVGNRQSVSYPNGITTTYTYDALNRLQTVLTVDSGKNPISRFDYTLYPTGQRHTITDLAGTVSTYTYDDLYRLTEESINHVSLGTVVNSYQYDAVGNRLSATENGQATSYVYDMNDRLLSSTQGGITTAYSYDDNGNTVSKTTSGDQTTFAYDPRNKLVQATHQQGGLTTANTTFAYDVDGNRIRKTDNGNIVNFVVDRNQSYAQVVQELDAQNVNQVTYTHGDDLISQDRSQNLNYYNYDGLGSTRSLTDSLGQITDTYDYNAYGTLLDQSGSTENNYLYTGEQFDASLDQYYLRARYYDPAVGRFIQMDSWLGISSDPLTLHKYAYGDLDPVNNVDPTGKFSLGSLMSAVNTAATLASTAQSSIEFFGSVVDGDSISATQVGMFALASLGGAKLFKLAGKKFLKRFNCGKPNERKICKIFKSDKERIKLIRIALGLRTNERNVAFADYITTSGVDSIIGVSGPTLPGTVGIPVPLQTGWDGHSRAFDAEVKLYSTMTSRFTPSTIGIVRVVSELKFCGSCTRVGIAFRLRHPKLFVLTSSVSSSTSHSKR